MSLLDWLDAGYWMLVEGMDPDGRALLDDLFESETEEQMADRFRVLQAEMSARRAEREEAEAKARKRRKPGEKAPHRTYRRVRDGEIEAAADEWDSIIAAAQAEDQRLVPVDE